MHFRAFFVCLFDFILVLLLVAGSSANVVELNSINNQEDLKKYMHLDHCLENLSKYAAHQNQRGKRKSKYKDPFLFVLPFQKSLSKKWTHFLTILNTFHEGPNFGNPPQQATWNLILKDLSTFQAEIQWQNLIQDVSKEGNQGSACMMASASEDSKCNNDFYYFQTLLVHSDTYCPKIHQYRNYVQTSFHQMTSLPFINVTNTFLKQLEILKKQVNKIRDFESLQGDILKTYYNRGSEKLILNYMRAMADILSSVLRSSSLHLKLKKLPESSKNVNYFFTLAYQHLPGLFKEKLKKCFTISDDGEYFSFYDPSIFSNRCYFVCIKKTDCDFNDSPCALKNKKIDLDSFILKKAFSLTI